MIRPDGISVTELNRMISEGIRRAPGLRNVTVTAEVSGFKHHLPSGHWYFSLKDPGAVISCVMFRQNNIHAACKPADGDRVTIDGDVEFYSRDGKIQLYVTRMRPAGTGSILENLEILKKKLAAEGLFDRERKKILPLFPGKVAVITSPSGAALHDILNVSGHRCPGIPIVIVPCQVQGAGAGDEIAAAVRRASGIDGVEVIYTPGAEAPWRICGASTRKLLSVPWQNVPFPWFREWDTKQIRPCAIMPRISGPARPATQQRWFFQTGKSCVGGSRISGGK